jgi:hypothetical protein
MTPKGVLAYGAGLLLLLLSTLLAGGAILVEVIFQPRLAIPLAGVIASAVLFFAALHLLAAGLYRMLGHLYRSISRTDLASDRPLRGRVVYLLGQIALAMVVPIGVIFLISGARDPGAAQQREIVAFFAVPVALVNVLALLAFLAGLGIMIWDLFQRHRDIVDIREAERRRRLDEEAEENMTEVVPMVGPADPVREHVREDR